MITEYLYPFNGEIMSAEGQIISILQIYLDRTKKRLEDRNLFLRMKMAGKPSPESDLVVLRKNIKKLEQIWKIYYQMFKTSFYIDEKLKPLYLKKYKQIKDFL